jgi:formiminotetrahydrofolate cyclodeaminase
MAEGERRRYAEEPLSSYLDDLAAKLPAPGGGSAAALLGAIGAALVSMVANFTVGKDAYKEVEEDIRRILEESEALRDRLIQLVDEDVSAYEKVSKAFKLPKGPEREREVENALRDASKVPSEVLERSFKVLELAGELAEKGNPSLITDVGIAALSALVAMKSAALNIEINLKWMKDEEFSRKMRDSYQPLLERGTKMEEETLRKVEEKL